MASTRFLVRLACGAAVLAAAELAAPAYAEPTDDELRAARELFSQAERDEDQELWQEAFDKLGRVSQVKLTAGVRYHLALCQEHLGRLATALQAYLVAEDQATDTNAQDVLRLVGTQLTSLMPRVPRLALQVAPRPPSATLTLDGATVEPARLGGAFPVDPGLHRVEARAAGYAPASVALTIKEGDVTFLRLSLTPLAPAGVAFPPPGSEGAQEHGPPASAFAIAATAGAGILAGLGVGAYLAAGAAHSDAVRECAQWTQPASCDSPKQVVRAWDWIALGAWGGAAGSAALAFLLWSRHVPEEASPSTARVVIGPESLGVAGTF
jgi:hypothetical protein